MGTEKEKTVAAVATDVTEGKQGDKCCGCCCDYRRAVIVLAIIGIVYYTVIAVLAAIGTSWAGSFIGVFDDDSVNSDIIEGTIYAGIAAGITALAALFSVFKLCAALKFNVCMLITTLVVDLITLAFSIGDAFYTETQDIYTGEPRPLNSRERAFSIILSCVFAGLFMYPTAGLIVEIKKGIMSETTYPREAYSCCCQPNV